MEALADSDRAAGRWTRRRFLRRAVVIAGGALAEAALAGCGGNDRTATPGPLATGSGGGTVVPGMTRPAAITEWGFGADASNPLAAARIAAFRTAYPNVNLTLVPNLDDQKILTSAVARQLPDLLWLGRETLASWAARGILRPLDDLIARDKFDMGRFYPAAASDVRYRNQTYGIPQFINVRALYVNTGALREIGVDPARFDSSDWNALTDLGTRLTRRTGSRVDRWGFDSKFGAGAGYLWGLANGAHFLSEDRKTATFTDPKMVDALTWAKASDEAQGGYQSYQAFATTFQNDEQFARGQVAITPYEDWMLRTVARTKPDLDFAVLPVRRRGGMDPVSYTTGQAWVITRDARDVEAAWAFITFMNLPDTWLVGANAVKAANKQKNSPYLPTLTGDMTADALQLDRVYEPIAPKFDDAVRLFPDLLRTSVQFPLTASPVGHQMDDDLLNDGIKPALNGERSPQDALAQANGRAQREIDDFKE